MYSDRSTALVPQFLYHGFHFVVVKAFAGIAVKGDAELVIDAGSVPEGDFLKPAEDFHGLGIVVLDLLEPGAAFVLEGWILFRLLVEADIEGGHSVDAVLFDLLLRAPLLIGADHLAELGAPVAQMIDAHGRVAQEVKNALQAVTDHGCRQMADMEAFADVDAGIIQAYGLSVSFVGRAEAVAFFRQFVHDLRGEVGPVQEKVHIAVHGLYGGGFLMLPRAAQGFRDFRRGGAQGFGQAEAGEGIVAEGRIRRNRQKTADFVRGREAFGFRPESFHIFGSQFSDFCHHIHKLTSKGAFRSSWATARSSLKTVH